VVFLFPVSVTTEDTEVAQRKICVSNVLVYMCIFARLISKRIKEKILAKVKKINGI
jgi:hypothetical protein